MKQRSDHDGRSKTASAVDAAYYPEQHEVALADSSPAEADHDKIALRAHELWLKRGCPEGSAEQDWFEAAEQLRAMTNSQNIRSRSKSGSVQH
jgi:hypothetical protein